MLNSACPEPFSVPAPMESIPSLNVTSPEGIPVAPAFALTTVAVKLTVSPKTDGLISAMTLVVEFALLTVMLRVPVELIGRLVRLPEVFVSLVTVAVSIGVPAALSR